MVLYVRVIQLAAQKGSLDEVSKYLQTGEQAQRDLANCASRSSFVQRYVVVLEELRQEARVAVNRNDYTIDDTLSYGRGVPEIGASTHHDEIHSSEFEGVNALLHMNKAIDINRSVEESGGIQGSNMTASNPPQWLEGGADNNFAVDGLPGISDWEDIDSLAVAGMGELDILFSRGWEQND